MKRDIVKSLGTSALLQFELTERSVEVDTDSSLVRMMAFLLLLLLSEGSPIDPWVQFVEPSQPAALPCFKII